MNIFSMILNDATDTSGQYAGESSWVYYLIGAIFIVLGIVCVYFSYRWRHSRQIAENYNYQYNEFVRFWQMNRFAFMVCMSVVCFLCAIIFMMMNSVFLPNSQTTNMIMII